MSALTKSSQNFEKREAESQPRKIWAPKSLLANTLAGIVNGKMWGTSGQGRELSRHGLRGWVEGEADSGTRDSRKGWGKFGAIISSIFFPRHPLLSPLL